MNQNNLDPDEWLLIATLVGEADLVIEEERRSNPALEVPMLDEVVSDFKEITSDFTDPAFLNATGAARRRNLSLFTGRPR